MAASADLRASGRSHVSLAALSAAGARIRTGKGASMEANIRERRDDRWQRFLQALTQLAREAQTDDQPEAAQGAVRSSLEALLKDMREFGFK